MTASDVSSGYVEWAAGTCTLHFTTEDSRPVSVFRSGSSRDLELPLVELVLAGDSPARAKFVRTTAGQRLRYRDHRVGPSEDGAKLEIEQIDAESGLVVVSHLQSAPHLDAFRTWTTVVNPGPRTVVVQALSTFAGVPIAAADGDADLALYSGSGASLHENRWTRRQLWDDSDHEFTPASYVPGETVSGYEAVSTSSRSTQLNLPTGVLVNSLTGESVAWQLEHNGAWRWELDRLGEAPAGTAGLVLLGPEKRDHEWELPLEPGDQFRSVHASLAFSRDGFEGAIAILTRHRRWLRRVTAADQPPALIFNDYMTTLNGDPTTARLLPLIAAAGRAGAEYFCIDAGWYDDDNVTRVATLDSPPVWWDTVGEWLPSAHRFPNGGIERVMTAIKAAGMQPGLWLEPEVVGINSPTASRLPDEAFLRLGGQRVVDNGRYFLDLRSQLARAYLDATFDRLIRGLRVQYFKLDFNVQPGPGTDVDAPSVGAGLLAHHRAYLAWFTALRSRHPSVLFENCSGGAMRADFGMLEHFDLQSTSDNENYREYPAIAAGAPVQLLPEQAGNWAYPQAWMDDESIAYTMVTGLSGRLYLSGFLDRMSAPQFGLVADAVALFKRIRGSTARSVPRWPAGLPAWDAIHLALQLNSPEHRYLFVWHRGGATDTFELDLGREPGSVDLIERYPLRLRPWSLQTAPGGVARVTPGQPGPSARVYEIR